MNIDFKQEVQNHKEDLLKDLFELLSVNSVLGTDITEETPFGSGPRKALDLILSFGERDGYKTKIVENKAGHIEVGEGEELFGILGHVDVVPVVEADWISHPFKPEVRDGKIYARGSLDDKGPTMAAYYAVKLLDKLGVKWNKRVRVIIGSDEETGFRCVKSYFEHEEQPALGFTPDAMFPLVYAEKARVTFDHNLIFKDEEGNYDYKLVEFNAGQVMNMVVASAEAKLSGEEKGIKEKFEKFLSDEKLEGEINSGEVITLVVKGKAAHGSTPQFGINAGTKLAEFLNTLNLDTNGKNYVKYIATRLANDPFGKELGIEYSDDEMGASTYNYGIFKYDPVEKVGVVKTDCRHPKNFDLVSKLEKLQEVTSKNFFKVRYGDIDSNMHVNNVRYVEWAVESLPLEIVLNYELKDLSVVFEKECKYGAEIIASYELREDNDELIVLHKIENDEGTELSILKSRWIKLKN